MTALALALEKQAQRLSVTERERLAEQLLDEMQDGPLTADDEAWIAEAAIRFSAWRGKVTKIVSAEKTLRDARRELRR